MPNQGKSRQTPFFQTALHPANPPAGWGGPADERSKREPRKIPLLGERTQVRASVTTNCPIALTTRHQGTIKAQSRQKTPVIVPNQGKSRQTPFFQTALNSANPLAGWGGPADERSKRAPRRNPLLGERTQVRACVITIQSPFFSHPQPIKAKTPAIKANQASSRQTQKINRSHGQPTPGIDVGCFGNQTKSNHPAPVRVFRISRFNLPSPPDLRNPKFVPESGPVSTSPPCLFTPLQSASTTASNPDPPAPSV